MEDTLNHVMRGSTNLCDAVCLVLGIPTQFNEVSRTKRFAGTIIDLLLLVLLLLLLCCCCFVAGTFAAAAFAPRTVVGAALTSSSMSLPPLHLHVVLDLSLLLLLDGQDC